MNFFLDLHPVSPPLFFSVSPCWILPTDVKNVTTLLFFFSSHVTSVMRPQTTWLHLTTVRENKLHWITQICSPKHTHTQIYREHQQKSHWLCICFHIWGCICGKQRQTDRQTRTHTKSPGARLSIWSNQFSFQPDQYPCQHHILIINSEIDEIGH